MAATQATQKRNGHDHASSRASSPNAAPDMIEPLTDSDSEVATPDREKVPVQPDRRARSTELRRSVSNAISRAATHLTTRSLPEPPPPPDGGTRAWTQVACAWLVIFTTWGQVNAFGAFQAYYAEILAPLTPSTVSWIGALQVWLTFFVGAFSGRLLDAGLFRPTLMVGSVIHLLGIFLMSMSTQFWQLMLTQGFLVGLGSGAIFTPAMGLISTYFDGKRAIAVGMATTGNSVGGLLYPVVVRQLLPKVGFPWTARVVGFINMFCLAMAITFMRPRLPPRKSGPLIDWKAFREPVYMGLVSGLFFILWGMYYTFYYIASFGTQSLGLPYSTASITVIVANAAGLPTRLATPFVARKYGPVNTVVPLTLVVGIVAFSWLVVRDEPGYYAFTAAYGLANGAFHCLMPTIIAATTPQLDMVGTRLGMAFSIIGFAALTGPPLGGALQGAMGGSFTGASIWAAVSAIMCFVLFVFARVSLAGWNLKIKC